MIKIGSKVKMNDKYRVSAKNKDKVFEVVSEPWNLCGTMVVKLDGAITDAGQPVFCLEVGEQDMDAEMIAAAEEHEQLAKWLEELRLYRAIGTPEQILANFNDGADTLEQSKEVIEAFMHKIEEYEAIGTVEECRVAVEKQRAKRPSDYQIDDEYDSGYCPCCGKTVYDDGGGYCPYCGQMLEWDEEE